MKINLIRRVFVSLVVLVLVISTFVFSPTTVNAFACGIPGNVTATPSSGVTGDNISISWNAQACDHFDLVRNSDNYIIANQLSPYTIVLQSPPESYTVNAYGYCDGSAIQLCASKTVFIGLKQTPPPQPATVSIRTQSCGTGLTWTTSDGHSGTDGGSYTFTPASSGVNVSLSATAPAKYTISSIAPTSQYMSPGGSYGFTITCTPPFPPPTVTLTSNPSQISCNETATLTWSSAGAVTCGSINSGTDTGGTLSGNSTVGPGIYQINCSNSAGTVNAAVNNNSGASCPATPTVTVTANPTTVSSGATSTISWSSTNVASCDANFWSGATLSGSASVSPASTTTYTKVCHDAAGTAYSASATVTVTPVASVTLTPSSQSVVRGSSATLSWSGTNVSSCAGTAPTTTWTNSTASSGSVAVSPTATTTYSMQCASSVGGANPTASSVVNVLPVTSATITVNDAQNTSWTISPGNLSGTGPGSVTVTPSSSGTAYSISGASLANYVGPTYSNSVTGSGSSMTLFPGDAASFTLGYSIAPAFDYSLSNSGAVTVMKGGVDQYGQNIITKTLVQGATQAVTVTATGAPANVDYSISSATCSPTCTSTVNFTVHPSAVAGTYPITITGSPLSRTTTFNLVIQNSPGMVVTCAASPLSAAVGQNVTWTGSGSGGSGTGYTYLWSGAGTPVPAPTSTSFTVAYSTVGVKSSALQVTDSLGNKGVCSPVPTVQVNFNPNFKEF